NALYPDALNHAIGHKFDDALAVKEFTIVSDPSNIDFNWDLVGKGDFDISFEVAIKPEVTLGDYKGIEVAKVDTTVSTEEVKAGNFSLEIGSGQFIPGFEEGMIGLLPGEERDVNVTFPEQYGAEHLAGKPAVFKVKLHEIKVSKGAELNDEFVQSLNREGVST